MNKPVELHKQVQREESASFDRKVIDYIHHAAATGLYEIRGLGAKRRVPHFDDLVFLARVAVALSAGGLPREMRDQDRARDALSRRSRSSWRFRSPSPG